MNAKHLFWRALLLCALLSIAGVTRAQGTGPDYTRALLLRNKFQALAINIPERANWIDQTSRFWYIICSASNHPTGTGYDIRAIPPR